MGEAFILTRDTGEASEKRSQCSRASKEGFGLPFIEERAVQTEAKAEKGQKAGECSIRSEM